MWAESNGNLRAMRQDQRQVTMPDRNAIASTFSNCTCFFSSISCDFCSHSPRSALQTATANTRSNTANDKNWMPSDASTVAAMGFNPSEGLEGMTLPKPQRQ